MALPQELTDPLGASQSKVTIKTVSAELWLGNDTGNTPLQICVFETATPLAEGKLKDLWVARHDGRAYPLILAAVCGTNVTMAGPLMRGNDLQITANLDPDQAGRILKLAKACPDRHSAIRFLDSALETAKTATPGLENSGLFADHVLRQVMSSDPDNSYRKEAKAAHDKAKPLLNKTGRDLFKGLGYATKANDARTDILLDADHKEIALAVLLHESERPDTASPALNGQAPITHAMTQAEKRNLRWVITVAHDRSIRLYPAVLNVGVGRRGPCETFVQLHTGLLKDQDAGLLWMLFSADALVQGKGAVYRLLADSSRFSGTLAEALRERIYGEVMPRLAKGIADARRHPNKDDAYLRDTLQMATHVLFRLLFIAYAEDKDLLPYRTSPAYQRNSLKTLATDILDDLRKGVKWGDTTRFWDQFSTLSQAISKGNKSLSVPAYNGVLFSDEAEDSVHGHALTKVKLKDSLFAQVLSGLLLTHAEGKDLGPVDFRSLGVREFGTIYEGLLESELSEAAEDLILKNKDGDQIYVTAGKKDEPAVREGEFYLHNKSGARKASGAYFTKEFAVDHLLDLALDKALDDHLVKLDILSDNDASEALFDFRIADVAMGSGHFLIFAIDRIERKFRGYLEKHPLPAVRLQLQELREAAKAELGESAATVENKLEDAALLRRLIARRCVYGVDMNPISVQLAQLAVWIHTFVPGLPLSFLEHNLIQGNSLIGVANRIDLESLLSDAALMLDKYLDEAVPLIKQMGSIADKNVGDVKKMKVLRKSAMLRLAPAIAALDIATWNRAKVEPKTIELLTVLSNPEGQEAKRAHKEAQEGLKELGCLHLLTSFPEVFLRKNSGFDVILGNPPWEKVKFEPAMFWCKHITGYKGMSSSERAKAESDVRKSIKDVDQQLATEADRTSRLATMYGNIYSDTKGSPERFGKSSGDPDLFKWFIQRFWEILSQKGRMGVVLPRTALAGDGLEFWRRKVWAPLSSSNKSSFQITMLTNKSEWVFTDVDPRYTVGLIAAHKQSGEGWLEMNGPFSNLESFKINRFKYGKIPAEKILLWSKNAALPMLPGGQALSLFDKLREQNDLCEHGIPGLGLIPYNELHSTKHKALFKASAGEVQESAIKVYKGESFDIWSPDRMIYHGIAKSEEEMLSHLQEARISSFGRKGSAFNFFGEDYVSDTSTLAIHRPRIAFRDVSRATDSRSIRACLLPPGVTIADNAVVMTAPGFEKHEAYFLGLLSSHVLDWYARRFIEMHFKLYHFNSLPAPNFKANGICGELVSSAGRLACPDKRFAKWAKSVGVEHGPLKPEEKQELVDRVDAVSALLYGLSEQELETVFETFHEGWDWKPDHARVLAEYRRLKTKHKI